MGTGIFMPALFGKLLGVGDSVRIEILREGQVWFKTPQLGRSAASLIQLVMQILERLRSRDYAQINDV